MIRPAPCPCNGLRRFVSLTPDEEAATPPDHCRAAAVCEACGTRWTIDSLRKREGRTQLGGRNYEAARIAPGIAFDGRTVVRGRIGSAIGDSLDATKPTEAALAASLARMGAVR